MGCWGITAFESDCGLDSVGFIRSLIKINNGRLELGEIIEALYKDEWCRPDNVKYGESHTSLMALAEIIMKFVDKDIDSMDYYSGVEKNKFSNVISFTASKESVEFIRNYISNTLKYAKERAKDIENGIEWNGWFKEKDWIDWQKHMSTLISRLDILIDTSEDYINLLPEQEQKNDFIMEQKL